MIEFRRHSQVQVHVQLVVMCDERFCRCPSRNLVHDWRLHLEEAKLIQVFAQECDDLGTDDEFFTDLWIDDQVEKAHSIAEKLN